MMSRTNCRIRPNILLATLATLPLTNAPTFAKNQSGSCSIQSSNTQAHAPSNMQWQTNQAAKAKNKVE